MNRGASVRFVVGFGVAVSLTGCDRIHSMFSHDEGSGASSSGSAGSNASTSAPVAATSKAADAPSMAGFEGEIDLTAKTKSSPTPVPINMLVKNDQIRFDVPPDVMASPEAQRFLGGGNVYMILKASEKVVTVVLDGKQEAVVVPLEGLAERAKAFHPGPPGGAANSVPSEPPKVTKTGKKDTVAGFPCEEWDIKNADRSRIKMCVANMDASFFHLPLSGIPTEHAWALELADGKHFPVRAIVDGKDGAEESRVEVTKFDKRPIDAAQFAAPPGYKQMSLDEMIASLSGGAVPPGDLPGPHKGHAHHHGKH